MKEKGIVFGIHPVREALKSGMSIDRIVVQQDIKSRIFTTLGSAWSSESNIPVLKVPKSALAKITTENHQGIVAYLAPIPYHTLELVASNLLSEKTDPLLLMLDHITDVKNFGAIVRSAEALGADALVIPTKGGAKINEEAIRSSSGAIFHVPICRFPNLIDATDLLIALGFTVVAASEKSHMSIDSTHYNGPVVVVMGSEEKGITRSIQKRAHKQVKIPLVGKTESLNVSVATGIILFEIQRQRNAKK